MKSIVIVGHPHIQNQNNGWYPHIKIERFECHKFHVRAKSYQNSRLFDQKLLKYRLVKKTIDGSVAS